ncbi:MAG: O-antigen ligase family protein [Sediminibacterium sp.]|nr:O-antigen ligase family protein [Sediminibacterium sp.]
MSAFRKLYLDAYVLVYALYAFFNKGIAYSYLAEILLVIGVLILLKDFRKLEIVWDRSMQLLVLFLAVTAVYIARGMGSYPFMEIIRDSFMINYAIFALILLFFKNDINYLKEKLFLVYKWYPLAACCSFLLLSYIPFFEEFKVFGNVILLLYKFGDMGVHLLISTLFMLNGYIRMSKRFAVINTLLTIYIFLVIAAYSRSGMLAYLLGLGIFVVFTKSRELKLFMQGYLRYLPLLLILALSLYSATKLEENFQGRKIGLSQLKENVVSIVSSDASGSLNDNKVWRLAWWGKIIQDSYSGTTNFLLGRGLGMSMAAVDDIEQEEEGLRSPHNFHLNILARFGVPFFLLWMYWMYLILIRIRRKEISQYAFTLLTILFVFIVNASFDVYLEGPMGAFPFWTFIGLYYVNEITELEKNH